MAQASTFARILANQGTKSARSSQTMEQLLFAARPVTHVTVAAPSKSSVASQTVVYALPNTAPPDAHWGWATYLIAAGAADVITRSEARVWLYSFANVIYSELILPAEGKEFRRVILPAACVTILTNIAIIHAQNRNDADADLLARFTALSVAQYVPLLPRFGRMHSSMLRSEQDWIRVYAYFGICCFALTKDITATGAVALTVARPDAIIRKYKYDELAVPYLTGDIMCSESMYEQLNTVWRILPFLRRYLFAYFSTLGQTDTTAEDDALHTTTRLMAWGDNSQVSLILRFISENEIVLEYEAARAALAKFAREFKGFMELCPPLLDVNGNPVLSASGTPMKNDNRLPFEKLIHGDKITVCLRHDHEYLLDMAVGVLRRTDQRLEGYQAPDKYPRAASDFLNFVTRYEEYVAAQEQPDM